MNKEIAERLKKIKLVLTDCDGVLTDTGVYYSASGEAMKRFSIRDGMGVERMLEFAGVETGIVTGEASQIVAKRAAKLKITELHLGCKNKAAEFKKILVNRNLKAEQVAFIGDDTNDVEIMKAAGLAVCPADATKFAKEVSDIVLENKGGDGAFREFAELIIELNYNE